VKYVRAPDLRRLPDEHHKLFVQAVPEILRPALDAGAHKGTEPLPRALRVHRIGANYSMTWSFAGPAGRAQFRLVRSQARPSWCGCASATTASTTPDPAWSETAGWQGTCPCRPKIGCIGAELI